MLKTVCGCLGHVLLQHTAALGQRADTAGVQPKWSNTQEQKSIVDVESEGSEPQNYPPPLTLTVI